VLSIGDQIRKFRQERGISLSALAAAANVSKSYISALENNRDGGRHPSADVVVRIAQALGVSLADLVVPRVGSLPVPADPLPRSLAAFADQRRLPQTDVEMLSAIKFRGKQPTTVEGWAFLYDAIKMTTQLDR